MTLNQYVNFPVTGTYTLIYEDLLCPDADTVQFIYAPDPVFGLNSDFFICPGETESLFIPDSLEYAGVSWGLTDPQQDTLYAQELLAGNYHAQLVTAYGCTRDTSFTIATQPPVNIFDYPDVCGDSLPMNMNTGVQNGLWSQLSGPGTSAFFDHTMLNTTVEISDYGTYVFAFNETTCNDADTVEITFNAYPWFDINGGYTCLGEPYTFTAYDLGYIDNYVWNTGTTGPVLTITGAGAYTLAGTNECGLYTETVYLVEEFCDIELPNVFSPNGDDANPLFQVIDVPGGFDRFNCKIFNRWGNMIYEFSDIHGGWDGKDMEEGTYFYLVEARTINGKEVSKQGFVQLIRK